MPIDFYYGSGSPYAWRVWLTLEHKRLPYLLKVVSFTAGDLQKPELLALNPRHKIPIIVDGEFSLFESAVIVDYLDEAYPERPVLPRSVQERAIARRLIREADQYLAAALEILVDEILFTDQEHRDTARLQRGRDAMVAELDRFESLLTGDWFAGEPGAVDYTLYPLIALALRIEKRIPSLRIETTLGPRLREWQRRVEALPYFATTYPPHWQG
jgi:glutathione S-transferase